MRINAVYTKPERAKWARIKAVCTVLSLLGAAPVYADAYCDELWLIRNQIFDRAGYCFSSALGRAVFGAKGCSTTDPVLEAEARRLVAEVRAIERIDNCAVDTRRTRLDVPHLETRLALIDPPIRAEGESACLGWRGPPLILRSGRSESAPQNGLIETGENILLIYADVDGWSLVPSPSGDARMGWLRLPVFKNGTCDGFAG